MRSDDAEPQHFHIISEGWDVIFSIEARGLFINRQVSAYFLL